MGFALRLLLPRVSLRHVLPVHMTAKPMNDDRLILCLRQLAGSGVSGTIVCELGGLYLLTTGE